ncbi:MAG: hypothetical protein K2X86_07710 [Cytophagaceae bacterium]|nr:hypothetical protein [Cytophagaceae bacterium]
MRRFILRMIVRLKSIFNPNRHRIDVDALIQDNLNQMKEIRMHRIRFYKFYKKAIQE